MQRPSSLKHRDVPRLEALEPRLYLAVVISEFMAAKDNNHTIADQFGNYPDWVELHNTGTSAVDLNGWHLTNDGLDLSKWHFPAVSIQPGAYMVVFASGTSRTDPAAPLSTDFKLTASGDFLALTDDHNNIVSQFSPTYPPQIEDVSYGWSDQTTVTSILGPNVPAHVLVPTSGTLGTTWIARTFNDSSWTDATTGIGYEALTPGLTSKVYKASGQVSSLAGAEALISTPGLQTWVQQETAPYINYMNVGGGGHFGSDRTFPGLVINTDAEEYVAEATASITIPAAGSYSFGVNSDDGFKMTITGATTTSVTNSTTPVGGDTFSYDGLRGAGDTLATYNFTAAGDYSIRLVFFEHQGGSSLEMFAAAGSWASWGATGTWKLVGDTANGGLAAKTSIAGGGAGSNYSSLIKTSILSSMYNKNGTAYIRIPFDVADRSIYDNLTLRMKYDDGFVVYLNGVEVARRNAPTSPSWNSTATATHRTEAALTYEDIDISDRLGTLRNGNNVLAIQGLNSNKADNDFVIMAELVDLNVTGTSQRYFAKPSPGWANDPAFYAFVADTKFSVDRGFYTAPFDVTITTDTAGAVIRYTTDGTTPTATHGTVYTSPVHISTTTTLRAAAFQTGYEPSAPDTQTYIFLNDVIHQTGTGLPATWGTQTADYGMDPNVVNSAAYSATIINDLKTIPTLSIVMDPNDLFGPSGIYSNPGGTGLMWEKATSVEWINPDGSKGFQVDAGIRIQGGVGRSTSESKHSFRLLFKSEYGPGKLDYPVFPDSTVHQFDTLTLRANFNDAWGPMSWGGQSQYIRDTWFHNTQLAMGGLSSHETYVQLYLNGVYWGLYQPTERPDDSFMTSYLGGVDTDYDTINAGAVNSGDRIAWDTMIRIANTGHAETGYAYNVNALAGSAAYQLLQQYVDVPNLIDYVMVNQYTQNWDWDGHNFWVGRQRVAGAGWKFFAWDSEWILPGDYVNASNMINTNNDDRPTRVFQQLRANPDFLIQFADHVYDNLFNDGTLTPAANIARYQALATQIDRAVVPESARWGDMTREPPYTRDAEWVAERNRLLNTYFPNRTSVYLGQLRGAGLYPSLDAPTFSKHGGTIPSKAPYYNLTMSAPAGTIYYTLDGTDPRMPGGAVNPNALTYYGPVTLTDSRLVQARAYSNGTWSAMDQATFLRDVAPPLRITEVMYHPAPPPVGSPYTADDFEFIEFQNTDMTNSLNVTGFRVTDGVDFTFPSMILAPGERAVIVDNLAAFQTRYNTAGMRIAGTYTGRLENAGERIVLESPLGGVIHDFSYQSDWYPQTDGGGFSLVAGDPAQPLTQWTVKEGWRPSGPVNGTPGTADTGYDPGAVIINELLAHTDMDAAPDYGDYVELKNTTGADINIGGWWLSDDALDLDKFRIPNNTIIPANGYKVFRQFQDFGIVGNPNYFSFSELGDECWLSAPAPDGSPGGYQEHVSFGASDREVPFALFTKSTGGTDFTAESAKTPGTANAYPLVDRVVINEVMYNPPTIYDDEWIELKNITSSDVPLYDPANTANTWRFTEGIAPGGVPWYFPQNASIPANGYALVVPTDPAAFRTKYSVPASVPIYGPYAPGVLSNGGDTIEIQKPGNPEPGTGFVPYYREDRLTYNNTLPWPTRADGGGASLTRLVTSNYGNDVANWGEGNYGGSPGTANRTVDTTPPSTPTNLVAVAANANQINLTWNAATDPESGILCYKVYRDNAFIGEAPGTSFPDADVDPAITYTYQVSAMNRDGLEGSRSPTVTARIFTLQSVTATNLITVQAVFTETIGAAAASNPNNYSITYGSGQHAAIFGVTLESDSKTVSLTLASPLAADTVYTLAIVGNIAGTSGYLLPQGTQRTFMFAPPLGVGAISREYWTGITGTAVANLTGSPNYPNSPSGSNQPMSFEAPLNWADNYGTRMRGYVTAPMTGPYAFWIASDETSELWLSTNEDPANKVKIAYVSSATASQAWTTQASQQSAQITLAAGQRYYIEALQKEGTGNDNLAVGWQLPNGTLERPIPGNRLTPYGAPPAATVSVVATDPFATERGRDPGTFTITRTGSTASSMTVYYTVAGTARSSDFSETLIGFVTIPLGASSVPITITPLDDAVAEYDESVSLILRAYPAYAINPAGNLATVVIADGSLAAVTSIKTNTRSDRSAGSIDPGGRGIRTIEVKFREPVTFTSGQGDVLAQIVSFPGGVETLGPPLTLANLTGSGTDTMLITLPDGVAVDTWVKVTLSRDGTVRNASGHSLDGEPKPTGNGRGYIYNSSDLPTGNNVGGGAAVFYVGNLRGDYNADGQVAAADLPLFAAAFQARNADADFRGTAFASTRPDSMITPEDIDGFAAVYQAARADPASGLAPLPLSGAPAAGEVVEVPAIPTPVAPATTDVDLLAAASTLARAPAAALASPLAAPAAPTPAETSDLSAARKHAHRAAKVDPPRIKHAKPGHAADRSALAPAG